MGFEPDTETLNEQAIKTGVVRLYDRYELLTLLDRAGFKVEDCRGVFLKPLPSAELSALPPPYLDALMAVGDELPDYCKQIVAVASCRSTP